MKQAMVISSYALLHRDFEILKEVPWAGVILDEAQNIKNPETKQARAARALPPDYRIALTGTPVENNVGDLWSIMEFLNPGFLGTQSGVQKDVLHPHPGQPGSGGDEAIEAADRSRSSCAGSRRTRPSSPICPRRWR